MATPSRRHQVILALQARLQTIRPDAGYATDLGLRVFYGRREPTEDDAMPTCYLGVDESPGTPMGNRIDRELPVVVQILARADPVNPLAPIEPPLEDVQRALWPYPWLLAAVDFAVELRVGAVRTFDREVGGHYVGAELTATVLFHETWPAPAVVVP